MEKNNKRVSIVNSDCKLRGNFNFTGYLILAGSIEGELTAERVATERGSYINGKIFAHTLTIGGACEGEITVTNTLTLLDTAEVTALIKCGTLVIEKGCILNGTTESLPAQPDS